jgi:hypothetical protein
MRRGVLRRRIRWDKLGNWKMECWEEIHLGLDREIAFYEGIFA